MCLFHDLFIFSQFFFIENSWKKERKKKYDNIKWHFTLEKHFREWISPTNERSSCVFHEFFFLTQRNKGKVFNCLIFFIVAQKAPLLLICVRALQLGSNKFSSLHGHMMKWLLTEVNWAWQWHFSFLLKKRRLHCSPPTKSMSTYLGVLIDCQSEKRKIT